MPKINLFENIHIFDGAGPLKLGLIVVIILGIIAIFIKSLVKNQLIKKTLGIIFSVGIVIVFILILSEGKWG